MSSASFKPRLAEWISFAIALAMILTLAGFLVYEGISRNEDYLPVAIDLQLDQAGPAGERFVLPIKVRNLGKATMRTFQIRVGFNVPNAPPPMDLTIDFLGEGSEQTIHIYTETDPRGLKPFATPLAYQTD